jgi:hypothetical protein
VNNHTCVSKHCIEIYTRRLQPRMPKKPRRNITEYRRDVNEARMRRKLKERENKKMLEENGEVYMKSKQNVLMGYTRCEVQCGVEYTPCDVECTHGHEQEEGLTMYAIIVDNDTILPEVVSSQAMESKIQATQVEGRVDNRLCGCVNVKGFIDQTPQ